MKKTIFLFFLLAASVLSASAANLSDGPGGMFGGLPYIGFQDPNETVSVSYERNAYGETIKFYFRQDFSPRSVCLTNLDSGECYYLMGYPYSYTYYSCRGRWEIYAISQSGERCRKVFRITYYGVELEPVGPSPRL